MASSASQLELPLSPELATGLAVHVRREGHTWQATLEPGIRVENNLGLHLHCSITTPTSPLLLAAQQQQHEGQEPDLPSPMQPLSATHPLSPTHPASPQQRWPSLAGPPLQQRALRLEPGGSADTVLTHWQLRRRGAQGGGRAGSSGGAAHGGVGPAVKLWLGGEAGWSSKATFEQLSAGVQVRCAGAQALPLAFAAGDTWPLGALWHSL